MFERLSPEPIYNTRAVVQRTSVPADTFRAWERRYGVPHPSRTSGNQRLYSERDIAVIGWLRDQTKAGLTISQAVTLLHTQSRDASQRTVPAEPQSLDRDAPGVSDLPSTIYQQFRDRLVIALLQLDGHAADRIVEEAYAMTNVESVCLEVLQSALSEIGSRWQHGKASVAVEHFAAAYIHRKLAALFNQSNPSEGRGPIVAACPEGELHEIGLLLTCVFISRRGFRVLYLGANLPADDLITTVERVQPPLVVLSATCERSVSLLKAAIPRLKIAVRDPDHRDLPEIGFGGYAFTARPELREGIDGTYLGLDAREAAATVERLFATLPA